MGVTSDPSKAPSLAEPPAGPATAAPALRLSPSDFPERERGAVLTEFFECESLKHDFELLPDGRLDADLKFRVLPGLVLIWGKARGSRNKTTREPLTADAADDVGMIVNLTGPRSIAYQGQELVLGDGEAVLMPLDALSAFTHHPPGDLLTLRVQRPDFEPRVRRIESRSFRRVPADDPALRIFIDYVKVAQEGISCPNLQRLVVSHIQDLMAVTLGATRGGAEMAKWGGLRAAKLVAIKGDIACNLAQPDLSVTALAKRHGVTPRFVQRLFEMEGTTFTEYVLDQRLANAYRRLTDPRREREKISAVAWDSGFGDVSYFNREFRRRYGLAPSDIRARSRIGPAVDESAERRTRALA